MANYADDEVGSSSPRLLPFNASLFDRYMTGIEEIVYDRKGQPRYAVQAFHNLVVNAKSDIGAVVDTAKAAVTDTADEAKASMLKTAEDLGTDLNNKHYTTYALMLADPQTRDNVVAVVDSNPDEKLNGWYFWDNTAKKWKPWADQPILESRFDTVASRIAGTELQGEPISFEDENGFVIGALTREGTIRVARGLETKSVEIIEDDRSALSVESSDGFTIFNVSPERTMIGGIYLEPTFDGTGVKFVGGDGFVFGCLQKSYENNIPTNFLKEAAQLRTQIMHVIGYGQSLGRGVNALPAISTVQPYKNIMIASGVRSREGESGYYPEAFSPLVEQSGSFEGETPIAGLCNGVVRRAMADGESQDDWVFLGSALGQGGRAIEQLMPSTDYLGYFNKMVRMVRDSQALATKSGKTYSVWAYSWDQGESNYENASYTRSAYLYTQYMLNLFDKLSEAVAGITGQSFRPYVFSYQVGAHRKYNRSEMTLALSQWRASRDRPDFVMAVPVYIFKTGSDSLHLTNESSWLLGEYKSRAMYVTMIRRGKKWRPLEPVSVAWGENYIDIKFNVPSGALVLDYALCNQASNYGFDVWEGGQLADIVTSVSVVGDETVRVSISRPASASAILSYAKGRSTDTGSGPENGARGNLRDSNGDFDKVTSPLGNVFALHNPCVMFQYDRISGF